MWVLCLIGDLYERIREPEGSTIVYLKGIWNTDVNYDFPQIWSVYEGMEGHLWEGFILGKRVLSNVCDLPQPRWKF